MNAHSCKWENVFVYKYSCILYLCKDWLDDDEYCSNLASSISRCLERLSLCYDKLCFSREIIKISVQFQPCWSSIITTHYSILYSSLRSWVQNICPHEWCEFSLASTVQCTVRVQYTVQLGCNLSDSTIGRESRQWLIKSPDSNTEPSLSSTTLTSHSAIFIMDLKRKIRKKVLTINTEILI